MAPIVTSHWLAVSSLDAALVWLDSGVCSQNPAHSFWIGSQQLPLCARTLGLFGGFLLTSLVLRVYGQPWRLLYLVGLIPMLIDGTNSLAADAFGVSAYGPTNPLRLATGLIAGGALALLLRTRNRSASGDRTNLRRDGILLCVIAVFIGLVGAVNPYLAVAFLASAGVLALIITNNRLAWPMPVQLAWALALPELALLATAKQGLLLVLR